MRPHQEASPTALVADFVISGTVDGADASSHPDEVTRLLGDDHAESGDARQLLRSYALAEFAWQRASPTEQWRGLYVMVQAHRFGVPLRIDVLAAALDARGFPLVEVDPDGLGCRRFVRVDSRVGLLVDEEDGAVLKATAPSWFLPGPRSERATWSREAARSRTEHLAGLDRDARERWVVRRRPEEPAERARWWWSLWSACCTGITGRVGAERAVWAELGRWLLEGCEAAGALDRTDMLLQLASHALLPPDETVRMCLDGIGASRAEVATRDTTAYSLENLTAVNLSRQAKRLSLATRDLLPRVRDPRLREEAEAWLELRPRLM
ncbi:hypothetical protein [Streptomyces sp. B1I3]|uniref:hypothetical protein n=1 Tax=Streptomyces sp. B1I3 TaxID=3042264 RepID=UPI0027897E3B|nr:hypothetical protein [Streptomyces sp. B1I3]MDQ0796748.1 hypothetical protein [Streptomyces sp. B1I3]